MLQTEASSSDDELLPYLRAANIQWAGVDITDIKMMWFTERDRRQLRLMSGDLLISEGGDVGRSCIWDSELEKCYFQNSVNRVRSLDQNSNRYLYYWIATIKSKGYVDILCNKSTIAHFTAEKVAAVPVPFPTSSEQHTIAAFLDRETAKIDALVAEQENLIALLKEKRQAVISHAVTKGLDPTVPMKDSGIEWLGEVPEHWLVCPLKRHGLIGNGSTPNRDNSDYWAEEGFPWLNSSVVNQDEVSEAQRFVTPLALKECHLPVIAPPAALVGITGQGKTRGMATRLAFTATVNQHVAYIKPDEGTLALPYLLNILESAYEHLRTGSEGAGSTKGAITCEQLGRLRIPLPELVEQISIARFLDHETAKLDELTTEAQHIIDLLKERRSVLVSAAVTGKIDVRGYHVHSQPIR
jgi:type I restriction enzyme S subunit